ncbi:MAG: glutamine-hydrolyzing carbamoyl-phosphate synthase small subunit [Blautia sp.]|nr:glutamine-hydrolyzing carbamoyl-phosphate synthase small subunit [Blautia sp.]
MKDYNRKLILEDGKEYYGYGFGDEETKICEVVFNTSVVGYQEILSDPSYTYQAVVMAYPLIGNYGMAEEDYETKIPTIGAMIVRDYNDMPSNFRSAKTLSQVMKTYHIPGIYGLDTRALVRRIRNNGSCLGMITDIHTDTQNAMKQLREYRVPKDAVPLVSRKEMQFYPVDNAAFHVVAVDCGMKENIVRSLNRKGCSVTVVPFDTSKEAIENLRPDGIFLSNGPGDPMDVQVVVSLIKELKGKYPMFGICLGHQMISLAYGAKTYKLKFGHRGGNHPVKNRKTGKIEITSQNHSYAVDTESLKETRLTATHINILDNTIEGVECLEDKVFSVQYHPESAPGPQDSTYLFDRFIELMKEERHA